MIRFLKEHTLIAGTLLLTAAGFLTRVLGFFYRIFLSRAIGAEGLGLYNMVHPVYGICFSLCAGSIQTALSRFIAANARKSKTVFRTALLISFCLSLLLAFLICRFSLPLPAMSCWKSPAPACCLLWPCPSPFPRFTPASTDTITACAGPWFPPLPRSRNRPSAWEPCFLIADILTEQGAPSHRRTGGGGHLIGEIASCLYTAAWFCLFSPSGRLEEEYSGIGRSFPASLRSFCRRLPGNCRAPDDAGPSPHGKPADLKPAGQRGSRMDSRPAFRLRPDLPGGFRSLRRSHRHGHAVYFLSFAITNSMAVLLLPDVAQAQADGKKRPHRPDHFHCPCGTVSIWEFCASASSPGSAPSWGAGVFHNAASGTFMQILAWLCPFCICLPPPAAS